MQPVRNSVHRSIEASPQKNRKFTPETLSFEFVSPSNTLWYVRCTVHFCDALPFLFSLRVLWRSKPHDTRAHPPQSSSPPPAYIASFDSQARESFSKTFLFSSLYYKRPNARQNEKL